MKTKTSLILFLVLICMVSFLVSSCTTTPKSPYPNCEVSGTVVDQLNGAPIPNAWVLIWNAFNTKGIATDNDGKFKVVINGSNDSSYLRVSSPQVYYTQVRKREWNITIKGDMNLGALNVYKQDVILFTSLGNGGGGGLHAIRANGSDPATLIPNDRQLVCPRWGRDGNLSRIAYLDASLGKVQMSNLDGSGETELVGVPSGYESFGILSFDWAERGVILSMHNGTTNTDCLYVDQNNKWEGLYDADFSPPSFEAWGGLIKGANLPLAAGKVGEGEYGIWFANPYSANRTNRVNIAITDYYPYVSWSPVMKDENNKDVVYILFIDNQKIRCAKLDVPQSFTDVKFENPWTLFDAVNIKQAAWSPDGKWIVGVEYPWGSLYKIPFSTTQTASYETVYTDPTPEGQLGCADSASWVEWR